MRKSDMTQEQLDNVALVSEKLASAGWSGRKSNELFLKGLWFPQEAVFDYKKGEAELIVLYSAEKEKVDLIIEDNVGRLNFVVQTGNALSGLLDMIVSNQDNLSTKNYKDFISDIVKAYPDQTFLFKDDQLHRLK